MKQNSIDILFGVDIYGVILLDGIKKGPIHQPVAQNSELGWLVFGALSTNQRNYNVQVNYTSISDALRRFWENEEVEYKPILSEEHEKCVNYVNKTFKRLDDGKMMVYLPFTISSNDSNFLGNSKQMALRRFYQMEKEIQERSIEQKTILRGIAGLY